MTLPAVCPTCGRPIPHGSPHGVCPSCLLQAAAQHESADPSRASATQDQADPSRSDVAPRGRSRFVPVPPDRIQAQLPHLRIIELIGSGGMGTVYKAQQRGLDRLVAVKVLPREIGDDPAFSERFQREARVLARLNHPQIVAIHDFGRTAEGLFYFVMEYVDGVNLRQLMSEKNLKRQEALSVIPQICHALQYAHDAGVVHRDIKPENILIDKKWHVKIADFGLAKLLDVLDEDTSLTNTNQILGTPRYMAPEQLQGRQNVDHRADIYSLGVVFYEMLTGELPLGKFPLPSAKVDVDERLDGVILRSLEPEPDRRYQQAREVRSEVESIAERTDIRGAANAESTRPTAANTNPEIAPLLPAAGAEAASTTDVGRLSLRCRHKSLIPVIQAACWFASAICLAIFLSFQSSMGPTADNQPATRVALGFPSPWFTAAAWPRPNTPFEFLFNPFRWSFAAALAAQLFGYINWQLEKARNPRPSRWTSPTRLMYAWIAVAGIAASYSIGLVLWKSATGAVARRDEKAAATDQQPSSSTAAQTDSPFNALIRAASLGQATEVKKLLDQGVAINDKTPSGRTALMEAAKFGHAALVRMLIEQGAEVNEKDMQGRTAIMDAAMNGQETVINVVAEIISASSSKAEPRPIDPRLQIDAVDADGNTALISAAENGHVDCVRLLVVPPLNANITIRNKQGKTALMALVENNRVECLRELLTRPSSGLGTEISVGNYQYFELFWPAEVAREDDQGRNAIRLATEHGHKEIEMLLRGEMERAVQLFSATIDAGGPQVNVFYNYRGDAWRALGDSAKAAADKQEADQRSTDQ